MRSQMTNQQPVLDASLFGRFKVSDGAMNEFALRSRRARTLLAMLCLSPGEALERDQVSKLLWPRRFKAQALASLRQCLHQLSQEFKAAECDVIESCDGRIAVRREAISTDLQQLQNALEESRFDAAIQLLNKSAGLQLLEGFEYGEELDTWIDARRKQVEGRLSLLVQQSLTSLRVSGDDHTYQALDKAWLSQGRHSYIAKRLTVAVLPFEQFDDLDGDYFLAEGVVNELSIRLGALSGIALIGKRSVNVVATQDKALPEIAALLNVSYLIDGTVHRRRDAVALSIRLIDGDSGTELWSQKFEDSTEGYLDSRHVIGEHIIAGLCRALHIEPGFAPRARMTSQREAYSLYLQGKSLIQKAMTEGAVATSIRLLEQALELDPDFAECWTALAEAHIHTTVFTPCRNRVERSQQAADCAKRALELDPQQGHAMVILGIHAWTENNALKALDYAFEAHRMEPNNADVTVRLGSFLLYIGRTKEALPYIEAGIEQDPVYGKNFTMLACAQFNLGNTQAALDACQRMVDLGMPSMWLAVIQASVGEHEAAVKAYYDGRLLMGSVIMPPPGVEPMEDDARDAYWDVAARGLCSGQQKDREAYSELVELLHKGMLDPHDPTVALPAIWMGQAELVLKIYSEQIHPANMFCLMSLWSDVEPFCRTVRHENFLELAEKVKMVAAWEKYGWPDLIPSDPRKK